MRRSGFHLDLEPTPSAADIVVLPLMSPVSGKMGREIEGPMAIVILGGLVTSTVINLLVLPTLAVRWARIPVTPVSDSSIS